MGRQKRLMRNFIGIIKDRASLIKTALSIKRSAATVRAAVIRATNHSTSSPPKEHRVAAVLALGHGSLPTARACIAAIMYRLHGTGDAHVALKCLITLRHVVARGTFILRDQLCFFSDTGCRNFLNVKAFRDYRGVETWEISSWVRWYGAVLESNLIASRILGVYISSSSDLTQNKPTFTSLLNSDLMREIDVLVRIVEQLSNFPDSLHCQKNDLVYEAVNLTGKDYRSTQRQLGTRLSECVDRIDRSRFGESAELTRCLTRLEECRERLVALFINRNRNDAFWDLVRETKAKAEEERERERWVVTVSEWTHFEERVKGPSQRLRLAYGGEWDRVHLTVMPAMA
ncbi:putative clathrin assembly protein At4g40080 [Actinidia eriantha]|uniref:putative clathrin assembly protein At4g40080 n=1 Tax=Actinidia eriantha TaxID=165200 RepID=UPI00258620D9|nr:putative clathrin assembly protein At4g40080 [Actinidia eriantha]